MRKTIIILLVLILVSLNSLFLQNLSTTASTQLNVSEYAQIKNNNIYLYKSADENDKWFLIEESYFVKILNSHFDFYQVEYANLSGYIKKDEVHFVKETPSFPFLENITFSTGSSIVCLREKPTNESLCITEISPNTHDIQYYGKIVGKEVDTNLGNIWIFCKINNNYGYIYSPFVKNLTPINSNIESFTVVSSLFSTPINSLLYLNLTTQNILIFAISLPIIFLAIMFFKKRKIN